MKGRQGSMCCALLGLLLTVGGCTMSIEPVVAESDAIADARLVGTWHEVGGEDRAVVARGSGNGYTITFTDDGETGRFEARLGRLGQRTVLDVLPAPERSEVPPQYREMLVPAHMLVLIDVAADSVGIASIESDSLGAALRSGSVRLTTTRVGDRLVLHGTTAELRAALAPYVARAGTVEQPTIFRRAPRSP